MIAMKQSRVITGRCPAWVARRGIPAAKVKFDFLLCLGYNIPI